MSNCLTTQVCIKKSKATHGPLTPHLRAYLTSVFANLEGTTNLWDKPIGSLVLVYFFFFSRTWYFFPGWLG